MRTGGSDTQYQVHIEQYKGAGLTEVTEKASFYLKSYPFDVVYIIAGVNDITNKDRQTGRVSFLWKTEEALTNYLIETRREGFRQLRKDHPGATIFFCPLVGLEFFFFFFFYSGIYSGKSSAYAGFL